MGRRVTRLVLALAGLTWAVCADAGSSFVISVQNASARVGEKAVIVATISMGEGFTITDSYRHRIIKLSASNGVELEREVVAGSVQNGSIVFTVRATPKSAGTHTVHGVFRFSYHNGGELDIRAAPFEATVTATE
ncbi:MAG: hypothetical protein AUH09_01270 [Candidatus Rokubacteria bacterium 13_2_20CM_70_12]|nr:MAG: hypothetical protein AUH09_01270 [Candidatus Rokubacteria bacterium 13_2_20CM_70_12]